MAAPAPDQPPQYNNNRRRSMNSASSSPEASPSQSVPLGQSPELRRQKSEREKRTYRACLHCRQRKSRCDLYTSGEPGRPPCERCIREGVECVLGGSRRGGKRIKRSHDDSAQPASHQPTKSPQDSRHQSGPSQQSVYPSPGVTEPRPSHWSTGYSRDQKLPPLPQEPPIDHAGNASTKMTVDDTIASADLQNPSDALEFLAHVADRAEGTQLPPISGSFRSRPSVVSFAGPSGIPMGDRGMIQFPPLQRGELNVEVIHELQRRYEDRYHPFFPIANPVVFDPDQLHHLALKEPHLLTAICTVASKDDKDWWQIHEICSAHMQQLIASLAYCGGGSVEAVEALLILAEWVPRRPLSTPAIGRGEEDQAAWMLVGNAIRLGYLLGLDRTAFRNETDPSLPDLNRRRLAWAACYMSDRQVSVRIGKAFWSRGPGPMTGLDARDFPSLQPRNGRNDDYAAIFQANLELTQLFSNAHDVLYSSKNRSSQLNFGGEYVKYIDDFRVAIRNWHSQWGTLSCSPPLKASLILSYEYLRLYCNAFAYQATLSRMVVQAAETQTGQQAQRGRQSSISQFPFTDFVAATPDARFIYDSVDAAKSLLSCFNSFVDPVTTFRFMPLRYYLYVIYSACFLYKARSTGVLGGDRGSVKRVISDTVERLQKASACANDVGDRYSRLIRLLWRKPPNAATVPTATATTAASTAELTRPSSATSAPHPPGSIAGVMDHGAAHQNQPQQSYQSLVGFDPSNAPTSINTFSWLDLSAVGDFATNNNSISGSLMDGLDQFDDTSTDFSNFDPGVVGPMMGPGQQQQFAWNGMSPPGLIF